MKPKKGLDLKEIGERIGRGGAGDTIGSLSEDEVQYQYDRKADDLCIYFDPTATPTWTDELDPKRCVKYANDGTPVEVKLFGVSQGVKLKGLPNVKTVKQVLSKLNLPTR